MYRSKSVLLSAFMVIALMASVNGRRLFPELVGQPRNISSSDRIFAHGYPAEWHSVETNDGYILNIVRIPHSSNARNDSQPIRRPAVLLMHGMTGSSDVFLLTGPNSALPFLLADAGYDVWIANHRGNTYSKRHRKLATNTRRFWHFGWHEVGAIDMAAIIDYMLELTGVKKVHFVGHSQGCTVYLVLMSMHPKYNEQIKTAHLLAPIAFVGHTRYTLITKLAPFIGHPGKWRNSVMDREFFPGNAYLQRAISRACGADVRLPKACREMFNFFIGEGTSNLNVTVLPIMAETNPAGGSTNELVHFTQGYLADEFRQFDYGYEENMKRYGQPSPPNYELDKVTSPIYIYYSDNDDIATTKDVERLALKLPNLKLNHRVPIPKWTHQDFLDAVKVRSEINDPVIKSCKEYDRLEAQ